MTKTFTAIIVDDEQPAVDLTAALLTNVPEIEIVGRFIHSPTALKFAINEKPDLVFLDINMPEISGIDFAKKMLEQHLNIPVIFITAYDSYILEAFRHNAIDYLLKPVSIADLKMAIERLKSKTKEQYQQNLKNFLQEHQKQKLRFNTRNGYIIFPEEDILFVLADGVYSKIQLKNGKEVTVSQNLGKVEALLRLPELVKIHRACIVNANYIFEVNKGRKKCSVSFLERTFQIPLSSGGLKLLDNHFISNVQKPN